MMKLSPTDAALFARRQAVMGTASPLFYDTPLHAVSAQGVWLTDSAGRRYLDAYNNVPHVGHCHPRVVQAITDQIARLNIHTRYLTEPVVAYAERLVATVDAPLNVVQFCCTGTEANELALRMARFGSGQHGVIVSDFSYHGNSSTLAALTTGLPAPEALAPWVRTIRIPDVTGCPASEHTAILAEALRAVSDAVASLQEAGYGVAALLLDTVFSTEGLRAVPEGYLAGAVARIRDAGGFFIGDEVQPGFGRTGGVMWGYQRHGIVPDFVTLGKPMGNGLPVAGVITRRDLLESFGKAALYFNTFGGNPVSAVAGLAVMNVLRDEDLLAYAQRLGACVKDELGTLATRHDGIQDVRGCGLFFGLTFVHPGTGIPDAARTRRVVNAMREHGVLISRIGPDDNVLKIRPPMVIQEDEAALLIATLDTVLAKVPHQ